MLRCTIEFIPHGDERRKEVLDYITIVNDGTGDEDIGNYRISMTDDKGKTVMASIKNHPRKQHSAAYLVARAIDACLEEE